MAKLIFTNQEHAGQTYELTLEKTTVGRAAGNTLVIPDGSLSAAHCEILTNGPEVIVRDLGSRNGTTVNGFKLRNQQSQLKSGQIVRFGLVEARLELEPPTDDHTASEITAVHAMSRFMREQQRVQEIPRPADPALKLASSNPAPPEDQTVTSLTASQSKETLPPARPAPAKGQQEKSSRKTAVIIALLVLGLAVLLGMWWGGK